MTYILGINEHRYQAINPNNNPYEKEFHDYFLKQERTKEISHPSEEMSDEALQRENAAQESLCREIAKAGKKRRRTFSLNKQKSFAGDGCEVIVVMIEAPFFDGRRG